MAVIARKETYGCEIFQVLYNAGFEDLQEGTLYPILTRLEKKGLIACRREKSPLGPIRKYFSITDSGREYLSSFRESYQAITSNAGKILFQDSAADKETRKI